MLLAEVTLVCSYMHTTLTKAVCVLYVCFCVWMCVYVCMCLCLCVCVWISFNTFSYSHKNEHRIVIILTDFILIVMYSIFTFLSPKLTFSELPKKFLVFFPLTPRYLPQQPHPSTPSAYNRPFLWDQVPHSHTTAGKILVLHILMLIFLDSRQ